MKTRHPGTRRNPSSQRVEEVIYTYLMANAKLASARDALGRTKIDAERMVTRATDAERSAHTLRSELAREITENDSPVYAEARAWFASEAGRKAIRFAIAGVTV